eukprot:scaffold51340_cov64-Phaeocystis_antarctica.AAC.3
MPCWATVLWATAKFTHCCAVYVIPPEHVMAALTSGHMVCVPAAAHREQHAGRVVLSSDHSGGGGCGGEGEGGRGGTTQSTQETPGIQLDGAELGQRAGWVT